MIASFFRHLNRFDTRYLLVSGQATILYGAATFSEDIDLWVDPEQENLDRLARALQACSATYYKLTPPLHAVYAARRHGFHFLLPASSDGLPSFLDVMGYPPRVGSFAEAFNRSRVFDTDWGRLPSVGIPDLVELKKTQRPRDYPIISRLVLAFLRGKGDAANDSERAWALDNMFSVPEFKRLVIDHADTIGAIDSTHGPLQLAADVLHRQELLPEALEDDVEDYFDAKAAPLRKADRHFWRPVIDDLRQLRAEGQLLPQGTPV